MNTQINSQEPTKVCRKCKEIKHLIEFYKRKISKDGFNNTCIVCLNQYFKKRYLENPEKVRGQKRKWSEKNPGYGKNWRTINAPKIKNDRKQRHIEHKEEDNLKSKQRHLEHREEDNLRCRQYSKQHYIEHKEEINLKSKQHRLENKKEISIRRKEIKKDRLKKDINYKTYCICQSMVGHALNGNVKLEHTMTYFMCTVAEFILHIEKQFLPGMNWQNRGNGPGKWNVDHIIPVSFFITSDPVEMYMCCRYQNLQPLWWEKNMAKGSKIILKYKC